MVESSATNLSLNEPKVAYSPATPAESATFQEGQIVFYSYIGVARVMGITHAAVALNSGQATQTLHLQSLNDHSTQARLRVSADIGAQAGLYATTPQRHKELFDGLPDTLDAQQDLPCGREFLTLAEYFDRRKDPVGMLIVLTLTRGREDELCRRLHEQVMTEMASQLMFATPDLGFEAAIMQIFELLKTIPFENQISAIEQPRVTLEIKQEQEAATQKTLQIKATQKKLKIKVASGILDLGHFKIDYKDLSGFGAILGTKAILHRHQVKVLLCLQAAKRKDGLQQKIISLTEIAETIFPGKPFKSRKVFYLINSIKDVFAKNGLDFSAIIERKGNHRYRFIAPVNKTAEATSRKFTL